ncbi:cardiolipin synthase [Aporhodopirellula aestuarii]|uniref:Cardiolipin synthase n=1 Tax=Aporhodopirellula aestuarii TaxID=2950107 RepID=A0ABT0U147_9BACT|nr:cardiolipin synthase [Aporhodopirellula aestuarii]MCM2370359.1 cardiolipin synthase [Aporhodopirellula aestuarii]
MTKYLLLHPSTIVLIIHWLIVLLLGVRVIMNRPATGVALAWLLMIAAFPFGGAVAYLLVGERRIGRSRAAGMQTLNQDFQKLAQATMREGLTEIDWSRHAPAAEGMNRLGIAMAGSHAVRGSRFEMFSDTLAILNAIARDVDSAEKSVLMEFYIWNEGGLADEVLEAVIRASQRGVHCCLLIDALGARPWWKSSQPRLLREAGVELKSALPVGLFRTLIGRTDLRLHRKIVVIDGDIAWTGSMNLVDPRFFKQDSGVGQWVDAMVRLQGAVVVPLAVTMIGDWMLESQTPIAEMVKRAELQMVSPDGPADIQVIPSGPGQSGDGLLQMILSLINASHQELVMTTPYLVPDDSLLRAIRGAAGRGVTVRLIVPEKVDSMLTRFASRSYYDDLLDVGVEIYLFRGGLLHTKSILVDGTMSMFGTVNLDMRSLWLNDEVALFVYEPEFATQLRQLQQCYLDDSDRLDPDEWNRRSFSHRFLENALRLVSPLL